MHARMAALGLVAMLFPMYSAFLKLDLIVSRLMELPRVTSFFLYHSPFTLCLSPQRTGTGPLTTFQFWAGTSQTLHLWLNGFHLGSSVYVMSLSQLVAHALSYLVLPKCKKWANGYVGEPQSNI